MMVKVVDEIFGDGGRSENKVEGIIYGVRGCRRVG